MMVTPLPDVLVDSVWIALAEVLVVMAMMRILIRHLATAIFGESS